VFLNTSLSCGSPQTPLSSPIIPPLDLVTVFYLIKLLKDILKVVKDTFKATEPQAINSSQSKEART